MANFNSPLIPVVLEREDQSQPWGFRIQGGADYRLYLSVKKVAQFRLFNDHIYFILFYFKGDSKYSSSQSFTCG